MFVNFEFPSSWMNVHFAHTLFSKQYEQWAWMSTLLVMFEFPAIWMNVHFGLD